MLLDCGFTASYLVFSFDLSSGFSSRSLHSSVWDVWSRFALL